MNTCLDETHLARIADGSPPEPEQQAHLDSCPECRRTLEQLRLDNRFLSGLVRPDGPASTLSFGPYTHCVRVADGGMSVVYHGLAPDGGPVAVKVCRKRAHLPYFEREVALLEKCRDAGIKGVAPLLSADLAHLPAYLATPFCITGTLAAKLANEGPLPPLALAALAVDLAQILNDLAACGILHGDIKPANILLDAAGRPSLTDLGVARQMLEDEAHTHPLLTGLGAAPATPAYMSPEQARGQALTAAADMFVLGGVLYEAAIGHHPFAGATPWEQASHVLTLEVDALPASLPVACAELIRQCLRKDPARRPSAAEIAALDPGALLGNEMPAVLSRNAAPGARLGRDAARPDPRPFFQRPRVMAALLAGFALVALIAFLLLPAGRPAQHRPGQDMPVFQPAGVASETISLLGSTAELTPAAQQPPGTNAVDKQLSMQLGTIDLNEDPLETSLDFLHNAYGIRFNILWDDMEKIGIKRDHPISLKLKGVSVAELLRAILDTASAGQPRKNRLDYVIKDGIVRIAPRAVLDAKTPSAQPATADEDPITTKLNSGIIAHMTFNGDTVETALICMRDATGLPLAIQWGAIEKAGIKRNAKISLTIPNAPAKDALRAILNAASAGSKEEDRLIYVVKNGAVHIAPRSVLEPAKAAKDAAPEMPATR